MLLFLLFLFVSAKAAEMDTEDDEFDDLLGDNSVFSKILESIGGLVSGGNSPSSILGGIGGLVSGSGGNPNASRFVSGIGSVMDRNGSEESNGTATARPSPIFSFIDGLVNPEKSTTVAGVTSTVATSTASPWVEVDESVVANATTNTTCATTPFLKGCCGRVLVGNEIERCCGNIPVVKNVYQDRCCVNSAGIALPLANPFICCNGLPYPKTTMRCCKTPEGNRPFPIAQDCPSF